MESHLTSEVCGVTMVAVIVTLVSVNSVSCHLVATTPHLGLKWFKKDYQQLEGDIGKLKKILGH